jgi:heme/copper-type cytochrome/quinol oxidase subunit 2
MNQPLAETIFWIAALVCAVAEIAILRSIIAQRRAQNSTLAASSSPLAELIWAIVPAIALTVLLVATWQRIEARHNHMQMNHGLHEMTSISAARAGA